jgi:hypothetical protein
MSTMMSGRRRGGAAGLALLLLGGGLAAAAPAQDRAAQEQVEIEISEQSPGKTSAPMKLLVGITDRTASQIHAIAGQTHYRLKVALQDRVPPAQVLLCELDLRGGNHEAQLKASVPVRRGARVAVGRVTRPDGSRLEVLATVR